MTDAYCMPSARRRPAGSRARVEVAPHRDVSAVEAALASRTEERAVVITDSVFSTDGALAPLQDLLQVCRRHRALMLVDGRMVSASGAGRPQSGPRARLAGAPDVAITTTLSKALGSQGGVCSVRRWSAIT